MHPIFLLEEPVIYLGKKLFVVDSLRQEECNCQTQQGTAVFEHAQISTSHQNSGNLTFVSYRGTNFKLIEIEKPNTLDHLYCKRQADEFEKIKHKFIKDVKKTTLQSRSEVVHSICDNVLLELIVGKVLPKLTGEYLENSLDKLTNSNQPATRQSSRRNGEVAREIIRTLNINITETNLNDYFSSHSSLEAFSTNFIKTDDKIYALEEVKQYLLNIFPEQDRIRRINNSAMIDEYIRLVQEFDSKKRSGAIHAIDGLHIRFDNKNYIPILLCKTENAQKAIDDFYSRILNVDAAYQYESQLDGVAKRKELEELFQNIINRTTYEKNGAGFKKTENGYYVYLKSGRFDIKESRSTYRFPSATVAVHLAGTGRAVSVDAPIVLNKYKHPFLPSHNEYQKICLGPFSTATFNSLSIDEKIVTSISKGIEVLKFGYKPIARPYVLLSNPTFDEYRVR